MKFTPTKEQLERLDEFRAVADANDYARLAALLGLPKPEPEPEELEWKSFRNDTPDFVEDMPGDFTETVIDGEGHRDYSVGRKREEEWEAQHDKRQAEVDAERAAYDEKREASIAVVKQWRADNAALIEAMQNWSDYFWRLDNPKEAAEQDAEDAKGRREDMARTLLNLKRFLKYEVTEDTIPDLIANAYSEWQSLGEEMRTSQENMEEHFSATQKYQDIEQCADTLENFSEPTVPEKFKETKIAYFVGKYRGSRDGRNAYACDQLQTVIDCLEEHPDEDDESQSLADELQEAIGEAEGLNFPGMFG
jgi:hypothetical protein